MWPDECRLQPSVGADSVRELLAAEDGMTFDEYRPLIAGRARSHSRSDEASRLKPLPQEAR
jgi:hypothetical protein